MKLQQLEQIVGQIPKQLSLGLHRSTKIGNRGFQNRVYRINEVETVRKHVPEINLLNISIKDEWLIGPQILRDSESEWPDQEPSIPQ